MRSLLLACASLSLLAQSGEEILDRVDRLRHPWPIFSVELTVKDAKAEQKWRVSTRENGDTRLDGLSSKEQGRSILMLGDQMWLLLPGTKRPMRVTPQQRLLGPAAGGDVARTRFREDYQVQTLTEETLGGVTCWLLDLIARRPASSARKVLLWVAKDGLIPLKADFHLASGKLARTAQFEPPIQALGRPVMPGLMLSEANGTEVTLHFSNWTKGGVAASLFALPGLER
jgi:outer membrane lipoprotein-sorting protein